ncbi:MAG: FAD-linked oxidase C-terminal domain-containing protein [Gammaproteobacteria bacterium]|nr:FAD-linked oxidase C-terminal domain-containing protein [Gammaproteobacteria bacterium]
MTDTAENLTRTLAALQARLGDRVTESHSQREHHSHDESWHEPRLPDAVCYPKDIDEVAAILSTCNENRVPVVPFGTGTGMEGGTVAVHGGICIDVSRMDQIVAVHTDDLTCTVQAGVTRKQLNSYLRDTGLYFPIDPGADASLGGMAATRASGTNAVRYGTMRENVLSLKAVLPDGSVVSTGRRARKSAAGYDLTRLLVGSEGTLGIIVELTLRLHGRPEAVSAARVCFEEVEGATQTTMATMQAGVPIARIELLDAAQMDAINRYSRTAYPAKPTLFLEFHGSPAAVREQAETVGEIAADWGGAEFQWTADEQERREMWQARHDAAYAAMALKPGCKAYATDVCVPISRLAECIQATQEDAARYPELTTMLTGHVGDGNFHYVFLIDADEPAQYEQVQELSARLVERALDMDGTCTGEHAIGLGKRKYLESEFGPDAVDLMRTIKRAVDPNEIMNPGKLLPPTSG